MAVTIIGAATTQPENGRRKSKYGIEMNALGAATLRRDNDTIHWNGRLPRFANLREGGPGRPVTLMLWFAIVIFLGWRGIPRIDQVGIDSSGPAMVFVQTSV